MNITMDYVMKARAASGLRAPKRHGTLHLTEAADYQALTQHCCSKFYPNKALYIAPRDKIVVLL